VSDTGNPFQAKQDSTVDLKVVERRPLLMFLAAAICWERGCYSY